MKLSKDMQNNIAIVLNNNNTSHNMKNIVILEIYRYYSNEIMRNILSTAPKWIALKGIAK